MMPFPTVPSLTSLLTVPRKTVASLAAVASFAVIGAINTASFAINKTADLIAWAANDRREESWAPFLMATVILILLARMLLIKLLQEQPTQQINGQFSPQQLKAAMKSFPQMQAANAQSELPAPQEIPFPRNSDFAKNLQIAGAKLFAEPASPSPVPPPQSRASTHASSPALNIDALLNAAFKEVGATLAIKKNK